MTNEKTVRVWTKKMLKQGLVPICLVCVDNDGFPHVLSQHTDEVLRTVYKHLAEAPKLSETGSFERIVKNITETTTDDWAHMATEFANTMVCEPVTKNDVRVAFITGAELMKSDIENNNKKSI